MHHTLKFENDYSDKLITARGLIVLQFTLANAFLKDFLPTEIYYN